VVSVFVFNSVSHRVDSKFAQISGAESRDLGHPIGRPGQPVGSRALLAAGRPRGL
jgi:hypothetical protein